MKRFYLRLPPGFQYEVITFEFSLDPEDETNIRSRNVGQDPKKSDAG